jgi:hypothetical protein
MEKLQEQFIGLILPAFEKTINSRKEYYSVNPRPNKNDVDSIISSSSNENGVRSGLLGFVPGPLGLVAIIPDLVLSLENQINMIYDIGVANGKEDLMTKETIMSMALMSGGGKMGINILTESAGQIVVKRAGVKAIQKAAQALGFKLTAGAVKSFAASYIPFLGGIAIGAWVKYVTREMGKSSDAVLSKNVKVEESNSLEIAIDETETPVDFLENKILVLLNLMKMDGKAGEVEKEYIKQIIEKSEIGFIARSKLQVDLYLDSLSTVNFEILGKGSVLDKDGLLIDMLALAKRDGIVHPQELEYILLVCEKINQSPNFIIDELSGNYIALKYFLKENAVEVDEMVVCNFSNKKAQFYKNNRLFIFDQNNQILSKGTYLSGGRKIIIDGVKGMESNNILDNLESVCK